MRVPMSAVQRSRYSAGTRLPIRRAALASVKMAACCAPHLALVPAVRRANPRCAAQRCCARGGQVAVPRKVTRRAQTHVQPRKRGVRLGRKAIGRLARALILRPALLPQRGSRVDGRRHSSVWRARAAVRGPAGVVRLSDRPLR